MAYKEESPSSNLFKKNTHLINLQGASCCSCSYCVRMSSAPTVTFKNFRRVENKPPSITGSVSGGKFHVDYFPINLPQGEFSYQLDFSSRLGESWDSPDVVGKSYQTGVTPFSYVPFKNCSGAASSVYNGMVFANDFGSIYLGAGRFVPGGDYSSYPYGNGFSVWEHFYYNGFTFNGQEWSDALYERNIISFGHTSSQCVDNSNLGILVTGGNELIRPCPREIIDCLYDYYSSPGEPQGVYFFEEPPWNHQPRDIGVDGINSYVNYMATHDFSFGMREGNGCENGVIKVLDYQPPSLDLPGYSPPDIPFYTVSAPSDYPMSPANSSRIIKDGYVLSGFWFDPRPLSLAGNGSGYQLQCSFSAMEKVDYFFEIDSCPDELWKWIPGPSPITESADRWVSLRSGPPSYEHYYSCFNGNPQLINCQTIHSYPMIDSDVYFSYAYDANGNSLYKYSNFSELVYRGTFYGASPVSYSTKYTDGVPSGFGINYRFGYSQEYAPSAEAYTRSDSFSYIRHDNKLVETNADGYTKVKFIGSVFSGRTRRIYSYLCDIEDQERDVSALIGYDGLGPDLMDSVSTYVSEGFACDIEIGFQSVPLCRITDLPSKLNSVEQLKIRFENIKEEVQKNTGTFDGLNWLVDQNPTDIGVFGPIGTTSASTSVYNEIPNFYYYSYWGEYSPFVEFEKTEYSPPTLNANEWFHINRQGLVKNIQPISPSVDEEFTSTCYGSNYYSYQSSSFGQPGRVFGENNYPDKFKSCLMVSGDESVWKTGNKVTLSGSKNSGDQYIPKSLLGHKNCFCVFVKKISDESQKQGNVLIRLAATIQDAISGNYIKINEYSPMGSERTFDITVKYKNGFRDEAKYLAPRYADFQTSVTQSSNPNLDKFGIQYQLFPSPQALGELFLTPYWTLNYISLSFNGPSGYGPSARISIDDPGKCEIESMSPLKMIVRNVLFYRYGGYYQYDYTTPYYARISSSEIGPRSYKLQSNLAYGFLADVVIEEELRVDSKTQLPMEFNQALEIQQYIQTSGVYSQTLSSAYRNPESCEHIGKIIDRKNCNCPKKWIRECDLHGKTDWKTCMSCQDFKLDS